MGNSPSRLRRALLLIASGFLGLFTFPMVRGVGDESVPKPPARATLAPVRPPTFNRDIAPILFQHCATCHRPGQSGPFSLLRFTDVVKHAQDIASVTRSRQMPPWPPAAEGVAFAEDRRLTEADLGTLQQWIAGGMPEGAPADLPPVPEWPSDWPMGKPDLIVELPPYELAPEGKDVYHNFVAAIPTPLRRFIRGVDLRSGNPRVVHHGFINVDESRRCRHLAERQSPPGFDGMELPESAVMPGGQLLGWQPGKRPTMAPDGLAWILRTNTDLVLQLHLNPSGKAERVQPAVAFYFTDQAPTNRCFRLKLTALKLDIPPDEAQYRIQESYTLPVEAALIRVGAHAHYLGRELKGYATLPSGERKSLLHIPNWDFRWQGDYGYAEPLWLPAGSRVTLDFTYDNSTNNPSNPHHPPRRVRFGLQSVDEMGEIYFQVLPKNPAEFGVLARDFTQYITRVSRDFYQFRIETNPADAIAHKRFGRILAVEGAIPAAIAELRTAIQLDPKADEPHFDLGSIFIRQQRWLDAYSEFQTVDQLNPYDFEARGSLGIVCLRMGKIDEAETHFEAALKIHPEDPLARKYLTAIRQNRP